MRTKSWGPRGSFMKSNETWALWHFWLARSTSKPLPLATHSVRVLRLARVAFRVVWPAISDRERPMASQPALAASPASHTGRTAATADLCLPTAGSLAGRWQRKVELAGGGRQTGARSPAPQGIISPAG